MRLKSLASAALLGLVAPLLLVPPTQALAPASEPSHPPVWDMGTGGERYVATGDSFASGPGIQPQRPGPCARSERNYSTLIAKQFDVNAFTDASCGGAVTYDFSAPQQRAGTTINAPQFDALGPDTTLVTFGTMGGNDIGLVQLATECVQSDCVPAPGTDPLAAKFNEVKGSLTAHLAETKRLAPNAAIVVVGYSTYVLQNCPTLATLGVTSAEAAHLQGQIDRLSDLLAEVSAAAGVTFADMRDIPGAQDHTACAAEAEQWIRGLYFGDDGTVFHPSSAGMRASADHLVASIAEAIELRGPVASEPEAGPTPEPGPTKAERRKALRAKAARTKLAATCTGARPTHRKVRLRVHNGKGAVSRVVFRVGKKKVGVDRKAPYVLQRKAERIKRHKGKVRAVVTFRDAEITVKRTIVKKRPRCMR